MHNYTSPFYEIDINARGCAVELHVNDMPCFVNYDRGAKPDSADLQSVHVKYINKAKERKNKNCENK